LQILFTIVEISLHCWFYINTIVIALQCFIPKMRKLY